MGPVCRAMLTKLVDDNPNGEGGFRPYETSLVIVKRGWARKVGESGKIDFYAVTDAGREALALWRRNNPGRA